MQFQSACLIAALCLNFLGQPHSRYSEESPEAVLPTVRVLNISLAPPIDLRSMPRADPVEVALNLIGGKDQSSGGSHNGGLWVSGNKGEALKRLRWIIEPIGSEMIMVDSGGRVRLNRLLIEKAAGVGKEHSPEALAKVINYICSDEGLLLLAQVTEGAHRYRLHIGTIAPTLGVDAEVPTVVNFDNKHDRRINPRRPLGEKFADERPPAGFDSLIGMNPDVQWLDLETKRRVPLGQITFHELAEAYAKLVLNLEYLGDDPEPGAHDLAGAREVKLNRQRPRAGMIFPMLMKCIGRVIPAR